MWPIVIQQTSAPVQKVQRFPGRQPEDLQRRELDLSCLNIGGMQLHRKKLKSPLKNSVSFYPLVMFLVILRFNDIITNLKQSIKELHCNLYLWVMHNLIISMRWGGWTSNSSQKPKFEISQQLRFRVPNLEGVLDISSMGLVIEGVLL